MQPHQQRVLDEKSELDIKIHKLVQFLSTDLFMNLDEENSVLLQQQLNFMVKYSEVLSNRIKFF